MDESALWGKIQIHSFIFDRVRVQAALPSDGAKLGSESLFTCLYRVYVVYENW